MPLGVKSGGTYLALMKDKIYTILKAELDFNSEIKTEYCLYDDLGMDSISVIDVMVKIENEFDISFTDDEVKEIKMVNHLVEAVSKKLEN